MNATADSYQSMLTREVRVCGKKVQLWYAKRFCGGRGQIFLEAKDSLCEAKPAGAPAPLESERKATQKLSCKRCVCPRPQAPFHQQLKPIKSKECTVVLNRRSRQNEGEVRGEKEGCLSEVSAGTHLCFLKTELLFLSFFFGLPQTDQRADHKRYEFKIQGQNSPIPTSWRV